MTFSLDLWQTILLISMVLGTFLGLLKLLGSQQMRHIDKAFESQNTRLEKIELASKEEAQQWQRVERELMVLKADLPVAYVRRDDHIRSQSILEAKLDGLASKIENAQLRGLINHGGAAK
jgi:ABC-type antimicrobial peptide transport system permease subunit